MACLGLKTRAAGWWAQRNPLSYGATLARRRLCLFVITITRYSQPIFDVTLLNQTFFARFTYCYEKQLF